MNASITRIEYRRKNVKAKYFSIVFTFLGSDFNKIFIEVQYWGFVKSSINNYSRVSFTKNKT